MLLMPNIAATLRAKAVPATRARPPSVVRATATATGAAAKKAIWWDKPLKRGRGRPSHVVANLVAATVGPRDSRDGSADVAGARRGDRCGDPALGRETRDRRPAAAACICSVSRSFAWTLAIFSASRAIRAVINPPGLKPRYRPLG